MESDSVVEDAATLGHLVTEMWSRERTYYEKTGEYTMHTVFLVFAFVAELAATIALWFSQGFRKRLPTLLTVTFSILSLLWLSFALTIRGFAMSLVYVVWAGVGLTCLALVELLQKRAGQWNDRETGPLGAMARLGLGLGLVGSVVHGQLITHVAPATWVLGLIGFPALMLVWHGWRIHRHPAPFRHTSPLSFVLSVTLPLALYFTWWYAPAFAMTSDAILIFVGASMVLAALRGYAGCELLALSNWLLCRRDQIACAIFTPLDFLERRGWSF